MAKTPETESFSEAIRAHCLECCCGNYAEVTRCHCYKSCSLWPWRFGMKPSSARKAKRLVDPEKVVCTCFERGRQCDLLPVGAKPKATRRRNAHSSSGEAGK